MLVEVRPVDRTKWHGKKGKESFSQPITIEALYDRETGQYGTGLNEEEVKKYSDLLGIDLNPRFVAGEAHPFYSDKRAWVVLPNHTTFFDTTKPLDFVKVKLMKANKKVANSLREYNDGLWPEATHVIFDEAEEATIKASKVQSKQKAFVLISKLTKDDKAALIQVIRNKNLKGRSDDFVDAELGDIIENNVSELLRYGTMGKEEVVVRASVLELIQKNILTKEGSAIFYMGDTIGLTYEDAVRWFQDPNNQKMKVAILEKLNRN